MTEQAPSWVAKRATCDLTAVFEELSRVVERDVDEMNKQDHDAKVVYQKCRALPGTFSVGDEHTGTTVKFEKDRVNERIKISTNVPNQPVNWYVGITWNAETLSCDLIVSDDLSHVFKVWQVSQKALEPMFFS